MGGGKKSAPGLRITSDGPLGGNGGGTATRMCPPKEVPYIRTHYPPLCV
jgi:hypothetical protein